nr:hypothetical protein [Cocleimonas sp. KMM 6896]
MSDASRNSSKRYGKLPQMWHGSGA